MKCQGSENFAGHQEEALYAIAYEETENASYPQQPYLDFYCRACADFYAKCAGRNIVRVKSLITGEEVDPETLEVKVPT